MVSPPLLVRFPVFFNVAPEWSLPKYARSEAKAHGLGGKQTPRNVFNEGVVSPVAHTDKNKGYPHYPCEDGCGSTSRTKETSGAQQVPVGSRLTPLTLCAHRGEHQVPDSSTPRVCLTGVHPRLLTAHTFAQYHTQGTCAAELEPFVQQTLNPHVCKQDFNQLLTSASVGLATARGWLRQG